MCEDGDLTSSVRDLPSAIDTLTHLWGCLGLRRGLDFTIGRRVFRMVLAAIGFPAPDTTFNQPVVARGDNKPLLELSVAEGGSAFVDAGLITAEDLDRTLLEVQRLNADETIVAAMPRMAPVWVKKPSHLSSPSRHAASARNLASSWF